MHPDVHKRMEALQRKGNLKEMIKKGLQILASIGLAILFIALLLGITLGLLTLIALFPIFFKILMTIGFFVIVIGYTAKEIYEDLF